MPRASLPTMTVSSRSTASLAIARLSRSWKAARWTSALVKVARVAVTRSTSAAARSAGVAPARGASSRSRAWRWTCGGSGCRSRCWRKVSPKRAASLGPLRLRSTFESETRRLPSVTTRPEPRSAGSGREAGAHRLADGAGVEVGGRLVAAGAAQAVLDLDGGDGFVGVDHVAEGSPGAAVVADAVDDDVDVLVVGVAVGEEDGLVVGEAHAGEDAAGGLLPLLAGEVLALGEAQAEVVDGLLDPGVLGGCVAH